MNVFLLPAKSNSLSITEIFSFYSSNDKSLRLDVRRTRLGMAPIERRIDIAELMDEEAPEDRKAQTIYELSHVSGNILKNYSSFKKILSWKKKIFFSGMSSIHLRNSELKKSETR